jgi:hypothetical protein
VRADPPELVVDGRTPWRCPEDLVAEGDGVVEEAAFCVMVDGALVAVDRFARAIELQEEIASPVEQGDIHILRRTLHLLEKLEIDRNSLVRLFLLELGNLLLEGGDLGHQRPNRRRRGREARGRSAKRKRLSYA